MDPSEPGFSEREVKKPTDPALLDPFPGLEAQLDEVRNLWGSTAGDTLEKLLTEFDVLFVKYKADFGKCKLAEHPVDVQPGAVPHLDGARESPQKRQNVLPRKYVTSWHLSRPSLRYPHGQVVL